MAGALRQSTGSYTWVTALMMLCNSIALMASYELAYSPTAAMGGLKARLMDLMTQIRLKLNIPIPMTMKQPECTAVPTTDEHAQAATKQL